MKASEVLPWMWSKVTWNPANVRVSTWLVAARVFQAVLSLVMAAMNGALLVYIHNNRLGLANTMITLEIMVCIALVYSSIILLVVHTGRRRINPPRWLLLTTIGADMVFNALMLVTITLLGRSGVPWNCDGLTRNNTTSGDKPDNPPPGYSTIRFSDEDGTDGPGLLDRLCVIEQIFYSLSFILIYTYLATITLSVLRICERYYTKTSKVDDIIEQNAYELQHIQTKIQRPDSTPGSLAQQPGVMAGSDGTISPPVSPGPVSPTSPPPPTSSSSSAPVRPGLKPCGNTASSSTLRTGRVAAEPTLDGPTTTTTTTTTEAGTSVSHHHHVYHHHHHPSTWQPQPVSPINTEALAGPPAPTTTSHYQYYHHADSAHLAAAGPSSSSSSSPPSSSQQQLYLASSYQPQPVAGGPSSHQPYDAVGLDPAEAAMVTDGGYRGNSSSVVTNGGDSSDGMPALPPYTPGPSRQPAEPQHNPRMLMAGHGDESNELRLSDYIKGQDRAQDMKDGHEGGL